MKKLASILILLLIAVLTVNMTAYAAPGRQPGQESGQSGKQPAKPSENKQPQQPPQKQQEKPPQRDEVKQPAKPNENKQQPQPPRKQQEKQPQRDEGKQPAKPNENKQQPQPPQKQQEKQPQRDEVKQPAKPNDDKQPSRDDDKRPVRPNNDWQPQHMPWRENMDQMYNNVYQTVNIQIYNRAVVRGQRNYAGYLYNRYDSVYRYKYPREVLMFIFVPGSIWNFNDGCSFCGGFGQKTVFTSSRWFLNRSCYSTPSFMKRWTWYSPDWGTIYDWRYPSQAAWNGLECGCNGVY